MMRRRPVVAYPVIFKYVDGEAGPFISVRSPNLPGLVVGASDARCALRDTEAGIARLLACPPYPAVENLMLGDWPPTRKSSWFRWTSTNGVTDRGWNYKLTGITKSGVATIDVAAPLFVIAVMIYPSS